MGEWRREESVDVCEGDLEYREGIVGDEGWQRVGGHWEWFGVNLAVVWSWWRSRRWFRKTY